MSNNIRIIARLDIKGPNVVKGIQLEGFRALGAPDKFSEYYHREGADELYYQDIVASLYDRNNLAEFISQTAKGIFIPLTVGGGLRTIKDIEAVLKLGADKVCINTAALENPDFIRESVKAFGSSTIGVAIEAIKEFGGRYMALTDNGRESTGQEVFEWVRKVEDMGAGEIIITSVNQDGTGRGYDIDLVKKVVDLVRIPVIAHGGAGDISHVERLIIQAKPNAVCIASLFHYEAVQRPELEENRLFVEGNRAFLNSKRNFTLIKHASIPDLKKVLAAKGIPVRSALTDGS